MISDEYRKAGLTERAAASADLARTDPVSALAASFRRHEQLLDTALAESGARLACREGCAYCCHFKVDVRADEALAIADFVRTRLDDATRQTVLAAAERNAATIRALTPQQHLTTNLKCCFLIEGRCSIYAARPFACRNFHATDVSGCIRLFNEPENLDVPDSFVAPVHERGAGHREGRQVAVLEAGLDVRAYDLTTAFLEALSNGSTGKRLRQGKRALIKAIVID